MIIPLFKAFLDIIRYQVFELVSRFYLHFFGLKLPSFQKKKLVFATDKSCKELNQVNLGSNKRIRLLAKKRMPCVLVYCLVAEFTNCFSKSGLFFPTLL